MIRAIRNWLSDHFFLWDAEDVRRDRWERRSEEFIRRHGGW